MDRLLTSLPAFQGPSHPQSNRMVAYLSSCATYPSFLLLAQVVAVSMPAATPPGRPAAHLTVA
jgi:hypothetical protein